MAENVGGIYYDVTLDTGKMLDESRKVDRQNKQTAQSFNVITLAVKALAAAYAAIKIADLADEWGQFDSRMKMATRSAEEHAHAQRRMRASANETFRAINETREAFIQMSPVLRNMGLSLDQSIDAIDTFSGLLVTNAASAEKGAAAMDALSKGLQKGKLDADGWASIASTMPSIVDLIASTTGKATDEVRRLGVEGKLSVNDLTRALVEGNTTVMAAVREMPTTFRDAIQNLSNGLSEYVGQVNRASQFSAILTSVVGGAGQVMEQLATQVTEANDAAAKLGKDTSVEKWANGTRLVLSYVADAADGVKRGFLQLGTAIGGAAAAAVQAAQGNLQASADIMRQTLNDVLDIGAQPYAGARMREAFANGDTGGSPKATGPANLKPPVGGGASGRKGRGQQQFDTAGYIASLEMATKEGFARIDAEEREALRRNAELLKKYPEQRMAFAQAAVLIESNASAERVKLFEQENKTLADLAQKAEDEKTAREVENAQRRMQARQAIAGDDPIAQLQLQLEQQSAMLQQYAEQDQANAQLYADAKVALAQQTSDRIAEIRAREVDMQRQNDAYSVALMSDTASQIMQIVKASGAERTAAGKALFAVQKALAVAEIIINTEVAASKAGAQLGIFGLPMAAMIRATGYASAGIVAGQAIGEIAGGRQYGGPVSAGGLYRVNETGRPEMFTAANGNQYMMPTKSGDVTPANQVGASGGQVVHLTMVNHFASPQDSRTMPQIAAAAARGLAMADSRNN